MTQAKEVSDVLSRSSKGALQRLGDSPAWYRLLFFLFAAFFASVFTAGCRREAPAASGVVRAELIRRINLAELSSPVYRSSSFDQDCQGNLYVASPEHQCILVVDTSGTVTQRIGSAGRGPGEFVEPIVVAVAGDSHLIVSDFGLFRISAFRLSGEFIAAVDFHCTPWLSTAGRTVFTTSRDVRRLVDVFDENLIFRGSVGSYVLTQPFLRIGSALQCCGGADTVWVLHTRITPPEVSVWTLGGRHVARYRLTPRSMMRNMALKEAALAAESKRLGVSGNWQHVDGFVRDVHGRFWVNYLWLEPRKRIRSVYYVFDSSFQPLFRVEGFSGLTLSPHFDVSGRLWVLEAEAPVGGEKGDLNICCYRILGKKEK